MPVYGSLPKPEIVQHRSLSKGDSSNQYRITIYNHTGTHIDAPAHFIKDGKKISDCADGFLVFNKPALIDIPKRPGKWVEREDLIGILCSKNSDCLIIRTGFGRYRRCDIYRTHNPGISPEAIIFIRQNLPKIRCLGIDSISVSGFQDRLRGREAHIAAFKKHAGWGKPLLLIEDLNLEPLKGCARLKNVIIAPWMINGIDSAPCTVLAEVVCV
jgi:kynurenine formamidase